MPTDEPAPVTLPGYAVADLRDYLSKLAGLSDHEARCDLLHEMAGYLRESLNRHAGGGVS